MRPLFRPEMAESEIEFQALRKPRWTRQPGQLEELTPSERKGTSPKTTSVTTSAAESVPGMERINSLALSSRKIWACVSVMLMLMFLTRVVP